MQYLSDMMIEEQRCEAKRACGGGSERLAGCFVLLGWKLHVPSLQLANHVLS